MRKILVLLLFCMLSFLPAFADGDQDSVLPSETGVVESIQYEDAPNLQQGDNNVKQIVKVKILSGKGY